MRRSFLPVVLLLVFISACQTTNTSTPPITVNPNATDPNAPSPAMAKPLIGEHGFDTSGVDRNVAACDDFYRFAVGKWRETHPLQPQYARYGRFEEVAERNRETLRAILEEAQNAPADASPSTKKLGDFYASCMNEAAIETQGLGPVQSELDRIDSIRSLADLQNAVLRLQQSGWDPLFDLSGEQDFKNAKMNIAFLSQSGLSLPDRDYYLRDDERFKTIRDQYVAHVTKMLTLAGEPQQRAADEAQRILALERKLAEASMSRVDMREPEKTYNITPVTQLAKDAPNFNWPMLLGGLNVNASTINVMQPGFFQQVSKLMTSVPLDDWKAYLRWRVLRVAAPALPKAIADENFNFTGRTLSGQQEQQPRWKRCIRQTDASLGDLLGQEYVRRNFTPEAKAKLNSLIDNLVAALAADIPTLTWMTQPTKQAALAKLNAFSRRIGYPAEWRNYDNLEVSRGAYMQNLINARRWEEQRGLTRIGQPPNPNEWGFFTPSTVNASYSPSRNDITFPAGILQPPFYDPNADDAYNYGGIGTVIGHEMTHGFDDEGAKFDAEGNLRDWWTAEDLKNFESRANCIVTEYSEFNVAPGININGKLVTGEAIADLGGATIALAAYEKSLEGKQRQTIDGFTPEQRFFLGFAQVWGENMAPQEQTRRALVDPHAQGPFRVNGTVANMPAFQRAFGCAEKAPMVREAAKRCAIW